MADAEQLFVEHRSRLFRYLCRAVGQADAANDLTQDVFLRVSRTTVPGGTDGDRRAWLFSIARNLALDHHRRQHREQPAPTPEARAATQDTTAVVNQALAQLTDIDRDVFLMREVSGLGYDEIAAACGLTPDAVRSRIHRARLQLRHWLSAPIRQRRLTPLRKRTHAHD